MYTEVPDPDWPPGYAQAVRQGVEAQWAAIREAETAARSDHGSPGAGKAALSPAPPGWPARVRDAWESYRQASATADAVADTSNRLGVRTGDGEADTAWWKACYAGHDADVAYEEFTATWQDWQLGPDTSAELEDPEAGS